MAITARDAERLEGVARELSDDTGGEIIGLAGDMSVMDDVNRTVDEATERLGAIDVLVTCAGQLAGRAARGALRGATGCRA